MKKPKKKAKIKAFKNNCFKSNLRENEQTNN